MITKVEPIKEEGHHSDAFSDSAQDDDIKRKERDEIASVSVTEEEKGLQVLHDDDDLSYDGDNLKLTKFIMKNGCCRECMKAFSKTGKSCLC